MEWFQDPNAVYLLLMAGLWISATGTYIPGTGIAEIGGAGLLEADGKEIQQHGRDQHDDDCLFHGVSLGVKIKMLTLFSGNRGGG